MNDSLTTISSDRSRGAESIFKNIVDSFFPFVQKRRREILPPQEIALGIFPEEDVTSIFKNWLSFWMSPETLHVGIFDTLASVLHSDETLLKEEEIINSVLKEDNVILQEDNLSLAVKKCTKIFHEDFPGNYILSYKGKKLGMFILKCIPQSAHSFSLTYFFFPDISDFKYL